MNIELIIAGIALFVTIIANIATISFFAGQLKSNQNHQKEMFDLLKSELKEDFKRLEDKQDKYNNVIERTYINERDISVLKEKISVENHRIKDLEGVQNEHFRKGN